MDKQQSDRVIDSELYASIGEAVVAFGRLEDEMRLATAEIVCPALEYGLNLALFTRVRFSELVEMYDFVVSYALREADSAEKITSEELQRIHAARQALRQQLTTVNERRNTVVHSVYLETHHLEYDGALKEITLEATKPFLGRRALEPTEDFRSLNDIREDIAALITQVRAAHQCLLTFDRDFLTYKYIMWEPFSTWMSMAMPGSANAQRPA